MNKEKFAISQIEIISIEENDIIVTSVGIPLPDEWWEEQQQSQLIVKNPDFSIGIFCCHNIYANRINFSKKCFGVYINGAKNFKSECFQS